MSLPPPSATSPSLLHGYPALPGTFNEIADPAGAFRPAWRSLVQRFEDLGPDTIARRWSAAQRVIEENGVTYNVYGDPRGRHRPWALDPVPLMIGADEWAELEAGLVQRATLLNHIAGDLYGPGDLLASGTLPADLVYANPNFLRPCVGVKPPNGRFLTLQAFDLARNPDGQWWVVDDRTQAPSGVGYALENRLLISRILPDLFRDAGVSRLARFFAQLRDTLLAMSPRDTDDPHVALLTPGPHNETYFEHAYLARYLGFTLVEAGDLTVRDETVFLKTLGGLESIDVILRRTDDAFCDPLELRADSLIGVAGLMRAVAAGNVAIANALGSGLVETSSLMPFLPKLCRNRLGEELRLPSVATWWCGQSAERAYTLEHLDRLVIKPAFAGDAIPIAFGSALTETQRDELRARIQERPHRYVAQETVALSAAPVWHDRAFGPRHFMLRVYVAATDQTDSGYTVMPGGLARVSAAQDSMVVSMQHGGGSKDTWILSDRPVSRFSLLDAERQARPVVRADHQLPSRVADAMFWLGRYAERAEHLAQLLRTVLVRLTEETSPHGSPELPHLLDALADLTGIAQEAAGFTDTENLAVDQRRAMQHAAALAFADTPASLRSCVGRLTELGSIVRDRISVDAWRTLRQIGDTLTGDDDERTDPTQLLTAMDRLALPLAAFAGLNAETMTHGPGWRFLDLGRRIERALKILGLVRSLAVQTDEHETMTLAALLTAAHSDMTYRSRFRTAVSATPTLHLLLLDRTNPRGVAFQIQRIAEHVAALPDDETPAMRRMSDTLDAADADTFATPDSAGERAALREFLDTLAAELPAFSETITRRYLDHAQPHATAPQRVENPFNVLPAGVATP